MLGLLGLREEVGGSGTLLDQKGPSGECRVWRGPFCRRGASKAQQARQISKFSVPHGCLWGEWPWSLGCGSSGHDPGSIFLGPLQPHSIGPRQGITLWAPGLGCRDPFPSSLFVDDVCFIARVLLPPTTLPAPTPGRPPKSKSEFVCFCLMCCAPIAQLLRPSLMTQTLYCLHPEPYEPSALWPRGVDGDHVRASAWPTSFVELWLSFVASSPSP